MYVLYVLEVSVAEVMLPKGSAARNLVLNVDNSTSRKC